MATVGRVGGIAVFLGPSLPVTEAAGLLPAATFLAPARMGSVYRAVDDGARTVGIVDGFYERVPAVWHKEILWALAEGVRVYGAASMGALRAAELDTYGMTGVGEIYRQYRRGDLVDDDEVALLHGTAESGYRPASVPLVNIRATLRRAVEAGVLDAEAAQLLIERVRTKHYPDRTYESLIDEGAGLGLLTADDPLRSWLTAHAVDQKRQDARELLEVMRADLRRASRTPAPRPLFERTWIWDALVAGRRDPDGDQ